MVEAGSSRYNFLEGDLWLFYVGSALQEFHLFGEFSALPNLLGPSGELPVPQCLPTTHYRTQFGPGICLLATYLLLFDRDRLGFMWIPGLSGFSLQDGVSWTLIGDWAHISRYQPQEHYLIRFYTVLSGCVSEKEILPFWGSYINLSSQILGSASFTLTLRQAAA